MAKPLAVDNSKLKEQARQRRQEQARLQQVTEKQPTKALFGPPIPVSRPNDPTFNKLSDCFGPYETGLFRPFFPNNDTTLSDEGVGRRQTDNSRHGDTTRHNDASRHGDNMRPGDNRHGDARHGDATRHSDGRQSDVRHGSDNRNSDNRNSHANDNATRNSRVPGHGSAALAPSGENAGDASRQGVFEQFVKSNSNAPARDNAQAPSLDGRHLNKTVKHLKPPDPTSGVRPSLTNEKMKNKTTAVDRPRPDRVEEFVVVTQTNCSVVGSRPDGPKLGPPPSKSSFSTPLQNSSPLLNHSSPLPNNGARDGRSDTKNSAWGHGSDPSKDYEKTSRIANPAGRVNGSVRAVKEVDMERKLTLNIPPLSGGHEKFDDFFAKLSKEVDIPLPLTAIMTPKKTDSSTFSFPAVLPEVILRDHDEIIPNARLSEDDEDDDQDEEMRDDVLLQRLQEHHLLPQPPAPAPAPLVAPADAPANVLRDLDLSSDSEDEQEKEPAMDQRSPPSRPPDITTSPGPTDHTLDPVPDSIKRRRMSESSVSSSEESCSSDSESDSSQSENEDDRTTEKLGHSKDDDDDENEDKQPKRPSWEISNFIPKSNEQVPFIPGLVSSSSSSPLINRPMSHDDFDNDTDPLKDICAHVFSQDLSPLPTAASMHQLDDSDFAGDITAFLSPSKDHLPSWALPQIDITPPAVEYKPAVTTPSVTPGSTPLLGGVDYCDGKPSVVVRICHSRLSSDLASVEVTGTDSIDTGICVTGPSGTDSASDVSCKSSARTNCKSGTRAVTPSEHVECSAEPIAADVKLSVSLTSSRTPAKRSSDASPGRTLAVGSQQPIPCSPSLAPSVDSRSSVTAAPADLDSKEARTEKSPRKAGSDRKDETYLSTAKGAKRKAEEALGRPDQKKLCERSNSSSGKEDRKSQSQNVTQNGEQDRAKGSRLPEPTNHLKSPALTASEDSSSRSSSSQKRSEKSKSQNGYSKMEEKPRKAAAAATTPCPDGSRNVSVTEPSNVSVEKPAKAATTPMVNGVGESPAYPSLFEASEPSDAVTASRKRTAPCEEDDQPLDRRKKDPVNGIKRPERLESSEFYLQQARRLKHEGDSGPDKFSKALSYIESVLAFISHCSALEQEHAETARIQKMYQDTMGLCQYIIRVIENVTNAEKQYLLVISLRIQSVICLKLYYSRKLEIAKLKTVLDEHNKSYSSKPLQIPSPYQAGHHHSANSATTAPGNWNHANGTPSPHSPRPSPSPAGSIGSVGSAGSSNGDSAGGMGKPSSLMNGHSMTSIVVPQRIHSVMMNYLSHTNHLYQCHESWDQADSILTTHQPVGEFFHTLDVEYGPIDLHSSTLAVVRYASEVVSRVRNNARQLSQATRAD